MVFLLFIHLIIGKRFHQIVLKQRRWQQQQQQYHPQCKFLLLYLSITYFSIIYRRLLVPFDEPATFANLALLITFTLALVQALLSMIGAVISCLWSPCCISSLPCYTPITTNSHYAQTTPHHLEVNIQILIWIFFSFDLFQIRILRRQLYAISNVNKNLIDLLQLLIHPNQ